MQFRYVALAGVLLTGLCTHAKAEQGCPDGFTPNPAPTGTPGATQCIPIGSFGGSLEYSGWNNSYGAVFFDAEKGLVGIGEGQKNRRRARKEALQHCQSKGGTDCKEVLWYSNGCAAVVWGPSKSGQGFTMETRSQATLGAAVASAKQACAPNSASGECEVFYSGCSEPVPFSNTL
ncbi:hypothetical protein GLE_2811 [Lysobacter enzymogenes]|uniref:Uncharacterized protein n=1 Tax=Lysobacter enzymogenes TaxID=69 RepID=A0A0S2DIS9_LYSEN|nr:DUF4189 domain-containing protein [Lysobacter enzymogenes]ALN58159.1 hypothetical protein GLE_2811 [Lysobacter enzymogenes]QCW26611.1 DUF4189 domain-containing protein [Lysobacter enzymogenes]